VIMSIMWIGLDGLQSLAGTETNRKMITANLFDSVFVGVSFRERLWLRVVPVSRDDGPCSSGVQPWVATALER
jgi:hypothetical protein